MSNKTKLIDTLKEIELKKLLDDDSLGSYAKIHGEHLLKIYPEYYYNLVEKKELKKYLDFVQKDATEMYNRIVKDSEKNGISGPANWKNAEDWVIGYLTSKRRM